MESFGNEQSNIDQYTDLYGVEIEKIICDGGTKFGRDVEIYFKNGKKLRISAIIDIGKQGITPLLEREVGKWGLVRPQIAKELTFSKILDTLNLEEVSHPSKLDTRIVWDKTVHTCVLTKSFGGNWEWVNRNYFDSIACSDPIIKERFILIYFGKDDRVVTNAMSEILHKCNLYISHSDVTSHIVATKEGGITIIFKPNNEPWQWYNEKHFDSLIPKKKLKEEFIKAFDIQGTFGEK